MEFLGQYRGDDRGLLVIAGFRIHAEGGADGRRCAVGGHDQASVYPDRGVGS